MYWWYCTTQQKKEMKNENLSSTGEPCPPISSPIDYKNMAHKIDENDIDPLGLMIGPSDRNDRSWCSCNVSGRHGCRFASEEQAEFRFFSLKMSAEILIGFWLSDAYRHFLLLGNVCYRPYQNTSDVYVSYILKSKMICIKCGYTADAVLLLHDDGFHDGWIR